MKGRKPRSVESKRAEGNPGHQRLPDTVLLGGRAVKGETFPPPDDLQADGAALWNELVPALIAQGTFDRSDLPIIHLGCAQWQRAALARRVLAQDGMYAAGSTGQIVSHPAVRQERDATREFMRIMEMLGAGPVGRARMGLAVLTGERMMRELDDALGPADFIEGDAVPMSGAEVGLPGA